MRRLTTLFLFLVLAGVIGGAVFLATWEIPAPSAPVEIVVPDDRFES